MTMSFARTSPCSRGWRTVPRRHHLWVFLSFSSVPWVFICSPTRTPGYTWGVGRVVSRVEVFICSCSSVLLSSIPPYLWDFLLIMLYLHYFGTWTQYSAASLKSLRSQNGRQCIVWARRLAPARFASGYNTMKHCIWAGWFVLFLNKTATSFFLPHQNLAKSHHLSSDAKDSKPLNYIKTDIRKQNIYNYD